MAESKMEIAKQVFSNLHRIPGFLWSEWYGPFDTIHLTDDKGEKLGITIQRRWVRRDSGRQAASKPVIIKGLSRFPIKMTDQQAMEWSTKFMEQAAELRGYDDEDESPVDQHTHMINIPKGKKLSVRNAIRLGFAVDQIINSGPTYFTQHSEGGFMNISDIGDYAVPDIRLPRKTVAA